MSAIVAPPQSAWSRFWRNAFAMAQAIETTEAQLLEQQVTLRIAGLEERLEKLETCVYAPADTSPRR
jgi:hypothetical protein